MDDNKSFENNDSSDFNMWKNNNFYYERDCIKYYVLGSEPYIDENFQRLNKCTPKASVRYLTTREIIEEYLNDPCFIFSGKVVPTGENGMITPIPPEPPFPPEPPSTPRFGSGMFQSTLEARFNGEVFEFETLNVEGNAIEHINGSPNIILAPNTTYSFDWVNISTARVIGDLPDPIVGATLLLDGMPVPGGQATIVAPNGIRVNTNATGRFTTGNTEQVLTLRYIVEMGGAVLTTSILSILVV